MIKIDSFDIITGAYKGTDVIGGKLDEAIIVQLQDWYGKNVEFIEYDGTAVEVAFLNFVKYHFNPMTMGWKRESNTYKVIDKKDHTIYRRVKHGRNRPRTQYNKR